VSAAASDGAPLRRWYPEAARASRQIEEAADEACVDPELTLPERSA